LEQAAKRFSGVADIMNQEGKNTFLGFAQLGTIFGRFFP
jgi:hypothetical protein